MNEPTQEVLPDGTEIVTMDDSAFLSPASRGEIDMQVSTAKKYPRSLKRFKAKALEMATLDEETASGCFYAMPRDGKTVEGPSVRLAEIVLSAWGNVRADARVTHVGDRDLTAEAMTWDLETNSAVRIQVKRRIIKRNGQRYGDDMIVTTGNAACAIALRNAVFRVIPMVYVREVYRAARQIAGGDAKTLAERREKMLEWFVGQGARREQVLGLVNRAGIEDVTLDDLVLLKGVATAIKDGDTTIEAAFAPQEQQTSVGPDAERVASKIEAMRGKTAPSVPAEPEKPAKPLGKGDANAQPPADFDLAGNIKS